MDLNDLTVNISHLDRSSLLEDWVWLIGTKNLPILVTASGDVFLQHTETGKISFMSVVSGKTNDIVDSIDAFRTRLTETDFVTEYFAVNLVGDLIQSGVKLDHNQIYSYRVPPALGGEFAIENIETTDIRVHFSLTGQIHEQIKDIPEGTIIDAIKTTPNK